MKVAAPSPLHHLARLVGATGLLLAVGACATNPVSGGKNFVMMTEQQEIEIGRANDPKIRAQFGVYDNPALQAYVQRVGEQVAAKSHRPELIYRFTVLDSPDVNAFALPGGYIYLTRGILAYLNSEAELAAVLGHEVGHVTARHSVRQYSAATAGQILGAVLTRSQAAQSLFDVLGNALLSGYGREHELEADRLGAEYLARNGYEPDAMIEVIGVLKNQEEFEKERAKAEGREPRIYHGVFATHPDADKRLHEVVAEAKPHQTTTSPRVGREDYLKQIDGLVFGDSAKHGVRHGSSFYHAEMNFALDFPKGWRLENTPKAVIALAPARDVQLQLTAEDLNQRIPPEQYVKQRLKVELKNGGPVPGTSLPSYTGTATVNTQQGRARARVTVLYLDNRAFVLVGLAKSDEALARAEEQLLASARSLRPLQPEEKRLAQGLRLHVVRAAPGDTFEKLAKQSPISNYATSMLRLINDKYPDGEPAPGASVKVIR